MDECTVYPNGWAFSLLLLIGAAADGRCGRRRRVLSVSVVVSGSGGCVGKSFSPVRVRRVF